MHAARIFTPLLLAQRFGRECSPPALPAQSAAAAGPAGRARAQTSKQALGTAVNAQRGRRGGGPLGQLQGGQGRNIGGPWMPSCLAGLCTLQLTHGRPACGLFLGLLSQHTTTIAYRTSWGECEASTVGGRSPKLERHELSKALPAGGAQACCRVCGLAAES